MRTVAFTAVPGTTNTPMPPVAPSRAITATSSAVAPSSTVVLAPLSTQPSAVRVAVVRTAPSSQRSPSANATVPVRSPAATGARNRCCASASPTASTSGANWVTVARNGPGAVARPSSSATIASST